MEKDDFQKMMANEGGLISFDRIQRSLTNSQQMGVHFVMKIDLKQSSTPFTSVAEVGY